MDEREEMQNEQDLAQQTAVPNPDAVEENAEQAPMSAADTYLGNLKNKYADRGFENDDDYYRQAMEDYDNEHEWAKETRKSNEDLANRLREDPYLADALSTLMAGGKPWEVLASFPEGFFQMKEGDEGWDEYEKMVQGRKEREAADAEAIRLYDENLASSQKVLEDYAQQTGRSPEQMAQFFTDFNDKIVTPIMQGKMTTEILSAIDKAFGYEEDLKKAEEQGRLFGRNEQISERFRNMRPQGDLPSLSGGGVNNAPQQPEEDNFIAKLAAKRGNTQFYGG